MDKKAKHRDNGLFSGYILRSNFPIDDLQYFNDIGFVNAYGTVTYVWNNDEAFNIIVGFEI